MFKRMAEQLQSRRIEKANVAEFETIFGKTLVQLQNVFSAGPDDLGGEPLPAYPGARFLGELGLNAFGQTHHIEVEQFPRFLNLVRQGRHEVAWLHHNRESGGVTYSTLLSSDSRFAGRAVRVLSNDIDLIRAFHAEGFHPPPPWIAWYEQGPFIHATQGDLEYWFLYVWDRYWESLSLAEQDAFLKARRAGTRGYISDEDWEDWLLSIRMRDRRSRD